MFSGVFEIILRGYFGGCFVYIWKYLEVLLEVFGRHSVGSRGAKTDKKEKHFHVSLAAERLAENPIETYGRRKKKIPPRSFSVITRVQVCQIDTIS